MDFKFGSSVYTFDGKDTGSLHRVVIDPETMAVTHIVILRGLLLKDDKVIPLANVLSAGPEGVNLSCTGEEIDEMSPLRIERPVMVSGGPGPARNFDPMTGGIAWEPAPVIESMRTIPEELVALKEGAAVTSADDEHVGNVVCVLTGPETHTVTHLDLSQGLLVKNSKTVPIRWVAMLDDEEVRLNVPAGEME